MKSALFQTVGWGVLFFVSSLILGFTSLFYLGSYEDKVLIMHNNAWQFVFDRICLNVIVALLLILLVYFGNGMIGKLKNESGVFKVSKGLKIFVIFTLCLSLLLPVLINYSFLSAQ